MALTGKNIRQLRSLAHHLNPTIIIGKGDVNDGTVEQANAALEAHELIKCSVLDTSSLDVREAANELAERCGAEVVQVIGRKFSICRETSEMTSRRSARLAPPARPPRPNPDYVRPDHEARPQGPAGPRGRASSPLHDAAQAIPFDDFTVEPLRLRLRASFPCISKLCMRAP